MKRIIPTTKYYHGRDHEPHCRCYDCQNVDYGDDYGQEEEEDDEDNSSYDSSDDGDSIIIRRLSGVRPQLPMHWHWHFNFDRDSVFGDDSVDDVRDGSDSRLHFRLVEAYHDYVCLWLERREAELRAMYLEAVHMW
jgi:hypothetical protein